jgi:hypothetical protein
LAAIIGELGIDCDVTITFREAKSQSVAISCPIVFMKTPHLDDNAVTDFEGLQAALPKARMVIIAKDAEDDNSHGHL